MGYGGFGNGEGALKTFNGSSQGLIVALSGVEAFLRRRDARLDVRKPLLDRIVVFP